jgi:sedoheptulokinase
MLLGIDIGTTKVAAVIADASGSVLADCSRAHGAAIPSAEGRSEQDAEALISAAMEVAGRLPVEMRRSVQAVGVTGQMHGVVVVDSHAAALTPLINWQDQRCAKGSFLAELQADTGRVLRSGYGCATLAWLERQGKMPSGAQAACTIHDLLVARLTGSERPLTDPTDAASWGLFDLANLRWDVAAVKASRIPGTILPEVHPCGTVAGRLSAGWSSRLGIPSAVPVAVAIGDNQASLLATLRDPEHELALTLGTGGQLSAVVGRGSITELNDGDLFEYRPFPGERYAAVAAALSGGAGWAWLADTVAAWCRDMGMPAPSSEAIYARLNELGLVAQDGVVVKPQFTGERHDPTLKGAFTGIGGEGLALGALARGLARGIVTNLRDMLPAEMRAGRTALVGSGNALRRNPLLQRMAEEEFALPLRLSAGREEAACGAALNARNAAS